MFIGPHFLRIFPFLLNLFLQLLYNIFKSFSIGLWLFSWLQEEVSFPIKLDLHLVHLLYLFIDNLNKQLSYILQIINKQLMSILPLCVWIIASWLYSRFSIFQFPWFFLGSLPFGWPGLPLRTGCLFRLWRLNLLIVVYLVESFLSILKDWFNKLLIKLQQVLLIF